MADDAAAVDEVYAVELEMGRQDARWGEQNHPDIGGIQARATGFGYARDLVDIREIEAEHRAFGVLGWDNILLEEVYEALSEPDDAKRREELIQVAAVALQWAGAIRRRKLSG